MSGLVSSSIINSSLLIDGLMDCGATYSSITLLDSNGCSYFSKSSSDKWFDLYIESQLYQKCHLMKEASDQMNHQKNSFVFIWDNYSPNNEESLYLDQLRKEINFCHGVAFCSSLSNGCRAIVTVTGKSADVNFSRQVLKNKNAVYKAIMKSLITQ